MGPQLATLGDLVHMCSRPELGFGHIRQSAGNGTLEADSTVPSPEARHTTLPVSVGP